MLLCVGPAVVIWVTSRTVVTSRAGGVERVLNLPAIGHAVAIGIGILRVGAMREFLCVGQAIVIRIASRAILASSARWVEAMLGLPSVRQAIAIGILRGRVCAGSILLGVGF